LGKGALAVCSRGKGDAAHHVCIIFVVYKYLIERQGPGALMRLCLEQRRVNELILKSYLMRTRENSPGTKPGSPRPNRAVGPTPLLLRHQGTKACSENASTQDTNQINTMFKRFIFYIEKSFPNRLMLCKPQNYCPPQKLGIPHFFLNATSRGSRKLAQNICLLGLTSLTL